MLHTLGSAAAVLGAALLVTRIPVIARLLAPLVSAGSMSLTLYSAHLILLATGVLEEQPMLLFLSMAGGAVTLAHLWRQSFRQGPLEAVVARLATATKNAVTNRPAARRPDETVPLAAVSPGADPPPRRRALIFLLVAGIALAAVYWVQIGATPLPGDAVGPVISVSDPSESDVADVTPPDAISQPVRSKPNEPASTNTDQQPEGDVERYCDLADEASAFDDAEEPEFSGDDQSATLSKMAQAAPAEIRDALNTVIDYERNRAGTGATAPDPATLQRARAILEKFDDDNC